MKKIALLAVMLFGMNASAQWTVHRVEDNPFDPPFVTAICNSTQSNSSYLKLEESDDVVYLFLMTGYVCDESVSIDLSFKIDGEWQKQSLTSVMVVKSKIVVLSMDLDKDPDLLDNFIRSTDVAVRINESHCDNEMYTFSGSGFTKAFTEVKEQ